MESRRLVAHGLLLIIPNGDTHINTGGYDSGGAGLGARLRFYQIINLRCPADDDTDDGDGNKGKGSCRTVHLPNACLWISPDMELLYLPRDNDGDDDDDANRLYGIPSKYKLLRFHMLVILEKACTGFVGQKGGRDSNINNHRIILFSSSPPLFPQSP